MESKKMAGVPLNIHTLVICWKTVDYFLPAALKNKTWQIRIPRNQPGFLSINFKIFPSITEVKNNGWYSRWKKIASFHLHPTNMEPENTPLEKEKHLQTTSFGFHVKFRGCRGSFPPSFIHGRKGYLAPYSTRWIRLSKVKPGCLYLTAGGHASKIPGVVKWRPICFCKIIIHKIFGCFRK